MNLQVEATNRVLPSQTETYMAFRSTISKPAHEDAHLRHILRFYMVRAMLKRGEAEVYVLPRLTAGEQSFQVDVAAVSPGKITVCICEPGSVTPQTEEMLEALKDVPELEGFVVHSQYGNPGNLLERFKEQLDARKFHVLAVVPPPFDDVYEYDIWMFETTFRNLIEAA